MENKIVSQRYLWIDLVKAFGIIFVILQHVNGFSFGVQIYDSVPETFIYSFNMPIFFFASGYLAWGKKVTLGGVGQKVRALILPAVIFYVLLDLYCRHSNPFGFISNGFFSYWFTVTLFECFLLYYVCKLIVKSENYLLVILLLIGVIGYINLAMKSIDCIPAIIDQEHISKYFLFFALGLLAKNKNHIFVTVVRSENLVAISLVFIVMITCALASNVFSGSLLFLMRNVILRFFTTYLFIVMMIKMEEYFTDSKNSLAKILNILKWIGRNSLPIYLLQYFFLPDFITNGFSSLLIPNHETLCIVNLYAISIVYTIYIIVLCWIVIKIVENSRMLSKYLFGKKE